MRKGATVVIINILKDGTVVEDLSKVEIPDEILKNIASMGEKR